MEVSLYRSGWLLGLAACQAPADLPGGQPAVQAWLVIHTDPLPRTGEACADPGLSACGGLYAPAWAERTENLAWLAETWAGTGRTVDLELGPEAALGWAEDPDVVAALASRFAQEGEADPEGRVVEVAAAGRAAIASLVADGGATLGVHVHDVLPDTLPGVWGAVGINAANGESVTGACEAWAGAPLEEPRAELVEGVVAYGVRGGAAIAEPLGETLRTFTGHLPRTMAGKIALTEDPEQLDTAAESGFSDLFQPTGLGSAYSECLTQAVDHPPLEAWPADDLQALGAGDGPLVAPANRVVGSLAEHLGEASDGSLPAAGRRLVQLLLNWRYQALIGAAARPWTYTFHAHLFDLYPGAPNPRLAIERDLRPKEGQRYRDDMSALAGVLDGLAASEAWGGVTARDGAVVRWTRPEALSGEGSQFSYASADAAPPEAMDTALYPYLPLVAEGLAQAHLTCAGALDGVQIYGFLQCDAAWAWGGDAPGYHCADASAPAWVYALVPEAAACLPLEGAARAAAIDDVGWGAPPRCQAGLDVPQVGLLLRPAQGPWFSDVCAAWP